MRDANTGCPSVGFAPITTMVSAWSTESKFWVPADVPYVVFSPYPVGEWHTRAQVSTLLLPKVVRTIFWMTHTSSLVQREEVMAPIALLPCAVWMSRRRRAACAMASSQDTLRHGSVMRSRIMGSRIRSRCCA